MAKNPIETAEPVVTDLPVSLLREIGRVMVCQAHLEWRLSLILYDLLDLDRTAGRLAVREPRAPEYLDLIQDLMELRQISAAKTDFSALREALVATTNQRDQLAHGIWARPKGSRKVFLRLVKGNWQPEPQSKVKRKIRPEAPEYDITDAASLVALIQETEGQLLNLGAEIDAALAPLRNRPTGPHQTMGPQADRPKS
jgi:hypothetical protein